MEEFNTLEKHSNSDQVRELSSCIEGSEWSKQPKVSILELLPDNTPSLLEKEFEDFLESEKKFKKDGSFETKNETDTESLKSSFVAGRLFEILSFYEIVGDQFKDLRPGTEDWERAEDMMNISSSLCKIAKNPKEYGLSINMRRIPDGVYIHMTKEGDFLVYGLSEAKLSKIDERVLDQVGITGSRLTIADVVTEIDEKISADSELGLHPELSGLAGTLKGRHLKVNWAENEKGHRLPKMNLDVVSPCHEEDPFRAHLRFESPEIRKRFYREIDDRVRERPSRFNFREISSMTKAMVQMMGGVSLESKEVDER